MVCICDDIYISVSDWLPYVCIVGFAAVSIVGMAEKVLRQILSVKLEMFVYLLQNTLIFFL